MATVNMHTKFVKFNHVFVRVDKQTDKWTYKTAMFITIYIASNSNRERTSGM